MKKLLSILAAFGMTATTAATAVTVVACSSNTNFKTFNNWIKNKETFIVAIKGDDCQHCNDLEDAMKQNKDIVDEGLNTILTDYNKELSLGSNNDVKYDNYTEFGREVNKVEWKELRGEKFSEIWDEKWGSNLIKWVRDSLNDMLLSTVQESEKELYKKEIKAKVKTALDTIKATPLFLIIRGGKLVDYKTGFDAESSKPDQSLKNLFSDFSKIFSEPDILSDVWLKIMGTGGSES